MDNGFYIAPFCIDGQSEGVSHSNFSTLSSKWLNICRKFLSDHGASFDTSWNGNLSHIQTKFTEASGVALVTFSVHGRSVCSVALLRGESSATESSVLKMFVNSLLALELVRAAITSPEPFQKIFEIMERPAMIVVPWPDEVTSEQDLDLIRELSIHVAAAFFQGDENGERKTA